MKKVLIVHPQFSRIGGAELVAVRIIDLVLSSYNAQITLLTLEPCNLQTLASVCNFQFNSQLLSVEVAYCPRWLASEKRRFHLLKLAYLHRAAKKVAPNFDLCISTYNEIDFGRRGFQYIHHPSFAPRKFLHSLKMIGVPNILDSVRGIENLYRKVIFLISKDTIKGFRCNVTAVNSEFMRDIVSQVYNIDSNVVYPSFVPKHYTHSNKLWEDRQLQFLSVGRISPDKNLHELIQLFKYLSLKFPEAKFTIVGRVICKDYFFDICKMAKLSKIGIEIQADVSNEELQHLLQSSKFYIGSKQFEHFGIAVLEAAEAGCLPFVHDSGGQREIITSTLLRYSSAQDLSHKISMLMSHKALRDEVFHELKNALTKLTLENFYQKIDDILRPIMYT